MFTTTVVFHVLVWHPATLLHHLLVLLLRSVFVHVPYVRDHVMCEQKSFAASSPERVPLCVCLASRLPWNPQPSGGQRAGVGSLVLFPISRGRIQSVSTEHEVTCRVFVAAPYWLEDVPF